MSQPAAPPSRPHAARIVRAWLSAASLALVLVTALLLVGPASSRTADARPPSAAASVPAVSGQTMMRPSAACAATEVFGFGVADLDTAAEFGLSRPFTDGTAMAWPAAMAYPDAQDAVPASVAGGSPERPPRAAL